MSFGRARLPARFEVTSCLRDSARLSGTARSTPAVRESGICARLSAIGLEAHPVRVEVQATRGPPFQRAVRKGQGAAPSPESGS
jgi:hypothetical protein